MIIALLRVLLHFSIDQGIRTTDQWIFNFRIIQIGLAIFDPGYVGNNRIDID